MGKKFWIVYLVLAAGSGALVWYFAPDLGARLPADVRAKICSIVDSATGKTAVAVHADEKVAVHADEKVATNTPPPTAVRPSRARRTPEELGVSCCAGAATKRCQWRSRNSLVYKRGRCRSS